MRATIDAVLNRIAAWHRRKEEKARRRHLLQMVALTADEARRLHRLELAELLLVATDLWVAGEADRAIIVLERERRAIQAERAAR